MTKEEVHNIVREYIRAYNAFDVEGLFGLLHKDVVFRNISNGEIDTETFGVEKFRELAEKSVSLFLSRRQTILDCRYSDDIVEVDIDYEGVLGTDLPNGLKVGDEIQLTGKSIFNFKDGKISLIEDHS